MRKLLIFLCLSMMTCLASGQRLGDYLVSDYLVDATHPNGCTSDYVTGLPNDSTWVNFSDGDIVTGTFGNTWTNKIGDDLLLETSYNPDNFDVRLSLSSGSFSTSHSVEITDWIQIADTTWTHLFPECSAGTYDVQRLIVPLDFSLHFGLSSSDIVTGIELTCMPTKGACDFSGAYIISDPPCSLNLDADINLCEGETLILDASVENGNYLWQDNSTNSTYVVNQEGTYWVEVVSDCGIAFDTIQVYYDPIPTVDLGADTNICVGETLILDVTTENSTYLWQDFSTNPTYSVTQEGLYWVEVTDNCGSAVDTISITNNSVTSASLGSDTTLCHGETLILDASTAGSTYLWQDSSFDPTYQVTEEGSYSVVVTDNCGSMSSSSISVDFEDCECSLFLPNIFSPNSDSVNSKFSPLSNCSYLEYHLKIYDRWGNLIFETLDPDTSWDGTSQGKTLQSGVYVYILMYTFQDSNGITQIESGDITLIK